MDRRQRDAGPGRGSKDWRDLGAAKQLGEELGEQGFADGGDWLLQREAGRLLRRDVATGARGADLFDAGDAFREPALAMARKDRLYFFTPDHRNHVVYDRSGKLLRPLRAPGRRGGAEPTVGVQTFDWDGEEQLVLLVSGLKVDAAGGKGTVLRLFEGERPKDLVVRGKVSFAGLGHIYCDTRSLVVQRKGKPTAVLDVRADGAFEGEADTWLPLDTKRWKLTDAGWPKPKLEGLNDDGWLLVGTTIVDVLDGKVAGGLPAGSTWVGQSDRHAFGWDPKAHRLDACAAGPWKRKEVSLPEAMALNVRTSRPGDDAVLLEGRGADRPLVWYLLPATGEKVALGEVPSAVTECLVQRADGRLWFVVGEPSGFRVFHVAAPEAPPARR